jgi:Nucleotidyl transferase AbiEii toxin, Type IV TA system
VLKGALLFNIWSERSHRATRDVDLLGFGDSIQAMVMLGMSNTRLKDFYDLWVLATDFNFDGTVLGAALTATFDRRRTQLPLVAQNLPC